MEQVGLPQGSVPFEARRSDIGDLDREVGIPRAGRQGALGQMSPEVEVGVVHPPGPVQPEGHRHQLAAQVGHEVHPRGDPLPEGVERDGPLEDLSLIHISEPTRPY